jgi:hypothetical protein
MPAGLPPQSGARRAASENRSRDATEAASAIGRNLFIARLVELAPWAVTGGTRASWRQHMNGLIYLIGLIVVIMAVLSLLGLH